MKTINGKEIKGLSCADGIHWYWGDKEVAVINQQTSEIEWCDRKFNFPEEVIQAIRELKPKAAAKWEIEVKRIDHSVTQGSFDVRINGKSLMTFGDDRKIGDDGEWYSKYTDEELGRLVYAAFWHPYDYLYHYSDKAKSLFYPEWEKEKTEKMDYLKEWIK